MTAATICADLRALARHIPFGDPIGLTIAEYVQFRRALVNRTDFRFGHMVLGHRVVLIPADWAAAA